MSLAASYLESRGLNDETVRAFRIGVVASPEPGFEKYMGRLAIPYFDRKGPIGFNFRCLRDHDCKQAECPKYLQLDGQEVGIWNVLGLWDSDSPVAHIAEGEIDGMTLSQVVGGEPVGALCGVTKWKAHFPQILAGFDRVVLWADPDAGGDKMRAKFRQFVPHVDIVNLPAKSDVNELYCSKGADAVRSLYEEEEDDC